MKKIVTLLLAVMMILTLAAPVFADDETGSITITGASDEATYDIYMLLDMESYDADKKLYTYKTAPKWAEFFDTDAAKAYFTTDAQGYVTWCGGDSAEAVKTASEMILKYAKDHNIAPEKSTKNTGDYEVVTGGIKFGGLSLGYYLLDSTIGVLCGLTATNPNVTVSAKNHMPTIAKYVEEDSDPGNWKASNTADIGQDVNFRVEINVHEGAQNFVLHDKMPSGFKFKGVTVIEHNNPDAEGGGYLTSLVEGTDYIVHPDPAGTDNVYGADCTFEVEFTESFCKRLETNDKIYVYYTAMLTKDAVIAGQGNVNEAILSFGEGHHTSAASTTTYTYGFDIIKTDSDYKLIDGATFRIYDSANGGNEVAVVKLSDGVYRRARADETGEVIVVADGQVRVVGFDNGVYYLEEVDAPAGYNRLAARQAFTISDANLDAAFGAQGDYSIGSGVMVVNKAGSVLPQTGGFGTTMFILVGTMLVLGAGVLLVTKKRMSKLVD